MRVRCFVVGVILGAGWCTARPVGAAPAWATVEKAMEFRASAVHSISMSVRERLQVSLDYIAEWRKWQVGPPGPNGKTTPAPAGATPERVKGFNWVADSTRWRTVETRFYPVGPSGLPRVISTTFDGERYYEYHENKQAATISTVLYRSPIFKTIEHNQFIGLAWPMGLIRSEEAGTVYHWTFAGRTTVAGQQQLKYVGIGWGRAADERMTVWVAPEDGFAPVKFVRELFLVNGNGQRLKDGRGICEVHVWGHLVLTGGVYLPTVSKAEDYDIQGGRYQWTATVLCRMSDIRVNAPPGDLFEPLLPPGTHVLDTTHEGAMPSMAGGDPEPDIVAVKTRDIPPHEEPDGGLVPPMALRPRVAAMPK